MRKESIFREKHFGKKKSGQFSQKTTQTCAGGPNPSFKPSEISKTPQPFSSGTVSIGQNKLGPPLETRKEAIRRIIDDARKGRKRIEKAEGHTPPHFQLPTHQIGFGGKTNRKVTTSRKEGTEEKKSGRAKRTL